MKTHSQQKEIEKLLNVTEKYYQEVSKLKLENKILKNKIKRLEKLLTTP